MAGSRTHVLESHPFPAGARVGVWRGHEFDPSGAGTPLPFSRALSEATVAGDGSLEVTVPEFGSYVAAAEVDAGEQPREPNSPASRKAGSDTKYAFERTISNPSSPTRLSLSFSVKDNAAASRAKAGNLHGG